MKYLGDPSSGSYAGITASRNRFGQYKRTRAVPVQPRTTRQMEQRARMVAASTVWRSLTALQIAGWAALGLQMTRNDSLGQSYTLTGSAAFTSLNSVLTTYGESPITDAPLLVTPTAVSSITITATSSPQALTVATVDEPATGFISFWASPPQSAGRIFAAKPVLISVFAVGGSPYNLLADWQAKWGALVAGQRIAITCRTMLDGFESLDNSNAAICA